MSAPAYGLAAVGAALLARTTSHRKQPVLVLLVTALTLALAFDCSPTQAGHLVAALLGLLAARTLSCGRDMRSGATGAANAPDSCATDGGTSARHRGGDNREGDTMNDSSTTRRRTLRWAGTAGLVAAGAVAGGLLMGAGSANAATTPTTSSSSSSSTSSSSESTPSTRATYPAHGTAAHETLEKPVTGSNATQAQAAAVKAVGGGTAGGVTTDVSGNGYEVTVTKSDGSQVEVHLNQSFGLDDHGRLSGE
jgi:hypothetical protein